MNRRITMYNSSLYDERTFYGLLVSKLEEADLALCCFMNSMIPTITTRKNVTGETSTNADSKIYIKAMKGVFTMLNGKCAYAFSRTNASPTNRR
jgi:hypothetical protein